MKKSIILLFLLPLFAVAQTANWSGVTAGGYDDIAVISMGEDTIWMKPSDYACEQVFTEVTIGTQVWALENLHCDDGGGGIYSYNNNTANSDIYGFLYTWDAAMRVAATVDGWHIPSQSEFQTLVDYLGGELLALPFVVNAVDLV